MTKAVSFLVHQLPRGLWSVPQRGNAVEKAARTDIGGRHSGGVETGQRVRSVKYSFQLSANATGFSVKTINKHQFYYFRGPEFETYANYILLLLIFITLTETVSKKTNAFDKS